MTIEPPFSKVSLNVLLVSLAAHAVQIIAQVDFPWVLFLNVGCLVYLSDRATKYAKAAREDFDAIIAAETIVAFGVLSLIFGIASALAAPVLGITSVDVRDPASLSRLAMPFLEGLATAGLSPFFAVVLRNRAFELERSIDAAVDMEGLTRAAKDLTKQMKAANSALQELQTSALQAGRSARGLSENLMMETNRLGIALHEGQANIKSFSSAAGAGRSEISGLADETLRLKTAASDTSTLLDALAKLVESVERFVAPRSSVS